MKSEDQRIEEVKEKYLAGLPKPISKNGLVNIKTIEAMAYGIYEAVVLIHERLFEQGLTLKWVRAQTGLTREELTERFRGYSGITPRRFISAHRIMAAKKLLEETDCPISAIALAVGYTGQGSFSNVFKTLTDTTPGKYRKSTRQRKKFLERKQQIERL